MADERSRDYLAEYDVFRRKMPDESTASQLRRLSIVPPTMSSPDEQHLPEGNQREKHLLEWIKPGSEDVFVID